MTYKKYIRINNLTIMSEIWYHYIFFREHHYNFLKTITPMFFKKLNKIKISSIFILKSSLAILQCKCVYYFYFIFNIGTHFFKNIGTHNNYIIFVLKES